jgi:hypothetical protein
MDVTLQPLPRIHRDTIASGGMLMLVHVGSETRASSKQVVIVQKVKLYIACTKFEFEFL